MQRAWWLAATNHWRTVAHCTQPEPRHLLQSGSEDTEKQTFDLFFSALSSISSSMKGWRPLQALQPSSKAKLISARPWHQRLQASSWLRQRLL